MIKDYSVIYSYRFMHGAKYSHCTARIIFHNRHTTVFEFNSTLDSSSFNSSLYAINSFNSIHWIVDINRRSIAFITNPYSVESTAEELHGLNNFDSFQTEELAAIIKKSMYERPILLQPFYRLKSAPDIDDDDLPF